MAEGAIDRESRIYMIGIDRRLVIRLVAAVAIRRQLAVKAAAVTSSAVEAAVP